MRVSNQSSDGRDSPFAELLRFQAEFQARLAEETMRYLRRINGVLGPAAPGTVMAPDGVAELRGEGLPGSRVELRLEVENRQRVHSVVTPMLAPLVEASGVTWFPAVEIASPSLLLAPAEVAVIVMRLPVPDHLPEGTYRGMLLLQGFREGGVPVAVSVRGSPAARTTAARAAKGKGARRRRKGRGR